MRNRSAAGVDPAGHRPVEALVQDDPVRAPPGERPERLGQDRVAAALDHQPGARLRAAGGRPRPAGRSPSGDRAGRSSRGPARHRPGRTRLGRAGRSGRRPCPPDRPPVVVGGQIAHRSPDPRPPGRSRSGSRRSAAVRPGRAGSLPAQGRIEPEADRRGQRLGGERRADRVDQVGPLDPGPQQVDPGRVRGDDRVAGRQAEAGQVGPVDPAVVGQVVDREERGEPAPADDRVARRRTGRAGRGRSRRASRGRGAGRSG